jgi:hypothetical protein
MVIGETFAYGHIPKTGGDAVHSWLAQIDGLQVDPLSEARKHHYFWERDIRKSVYVLSIRRLPFWTLSYLHQLAFHPAAARHYGIPPDDTVQPEYAFALKPDEYLRQHQVGGREIGVWLRMEYLFDDVIRFIEEYIQPVTTHLRQRLLAVPTKGQRDYNHNVLDFFTPDQIAAVYARNPIWSAVETNVYGGLYGQERASGNELDFPTGVDTKAASQRATASAPGSGCPRARSPR